MNHQSASLKPTERMCGGGHWLYFLVVDDKNSIPLTLPVRELLAAHVQKCLPCPRTRETAAANQPSRAVGGEAAGTRME